MHLDTNTKLAILSAYNGRRGDLPRAHSVASRPNHRRIASLGRKGEKPRLNVAHFLVKAGPEAWALIGPAMNGDPAALERLRRITRTLERPRRKRSSGRPDRGAPLANTPCEGTCRERKTLRVILEWAEATLGYAEHFPEDLQMRVSRRMERGYGTHMVRGGVHRITLSYRLFRHGIEGILLDTALHELAHLLDATTNPRGRSSHGPSWREWCHRLGAIPTRLMSPEAGARVRIAAEEDVPGRIPDVVQEWLDQQGEVDAT